MTQREQQKCNNARSVRTLTIGLLEKTAYSFERAHVLTRGLLKPPNDLQAALIKQQLKFSIHHAVVLSSRIEVSQSTWIAGSKRTPSSPWILRLVSGTRSRWTPT